MADDIRIAVREYILKQFLPDENPDELTDTTPLITGGVLDSIATLKLVMFLEGRFSIAFQAHEAGADHLDTVTDICKIIRAKRS